jgi:hypothetical protein
VSITLSVFKLIFHLNETLVVQNQKKTQRPNAAVAAFNLNEVLMFMLLRLLRKVVSLVRLSAKKMNSLLLLVSVSSAEPLARAGVPRVRLHYRQVFRTGSSLTEIWNFSGNARNTNEY